MWSLTFNQKSAGQTLKIVAVTNSKNIKRSTHYLGDKREIDVSSEGPSSGISKLNSVLYRW